MHRPRNSETISFGVMPATLLLAWLVMPALGQENQASGGGMVEDWTHHHLVFSNPGTEEDSLKKGTYEDWRRIVTDPRNRLQWMKRYGASVAQATVDPYRFPRFPHDPIEPGPPRYPRNPGPPHREPPRGFEIGGNQIHADWSWVLGNSNHGVAGDEYPAKYSFSPIGPPDCVSDFVVFPINAIGNSAQAEIIGLNNLYSGTCTGSVPNSLFSYDVGSGDVQTSPVLSLDGTKVAFVETISGGSYFHVLTIDKSGNSGCPSASPCNGTA